jgi:transposase-like protein
VTTAVHNAKVNRERQDMNLVKLIEQFGSDERCRAYLEALRWPEGVRCPNCGAKSISHISTRKQLDCNSCRTRFSVTSGTVFHDSHLPLWKWFLATYMITEAKKGVSANQLKRTLAVSYKTAWYLCHRIRWAMKEAAAELLTGTVEVDETFVGGKARGGSKARGKGSGTRVGKTMVLGAIQRGGDVRMRVERRPVATADVLHRFIRETVGEEAEAIFTDSHPGYRGIADGDTRHEVVDHGSEEWVRADVHTNTVESVWSLLKRSIVGSYHQLSAKHLEAYLDEIAFRFNNRENPYLFRDTLRKLLTEDPLTYRTLVNA